MLTQVILDTSTPMTFDIEAVDPDEILILKSISGLSPADVNLFTGDFARDGGYYQGRRAVKRNPVLNFKINPDYANDIEASDIRELLYRNFMEPFATNDGMSVTLKDDRKPDRYFIGYTEKIETDLFSKDLSAQVSMLCTDPYIRSSAEVVVNYSAGTEPISTPITYNGSAKTGISIKIRANSSSANMFLKNVTTGQIMQLTRAVVADNYYIINTNIGSRSIVDQAAVDRMATLTAASKWIQLVPGVNTLQTYGTTPGDGVSEIVNYSFREAWWGV